MASNAPSLTGSVRVGEMNLKHRVVMSAMTRTRCDPITEAPREVNALFYEQRASDGGLLVTECMPLNATSRGYVRAPGVHSAAQVEGWKMVLNRVHAKGAYCYAQIYHPGRTSHSSLIGGQTPIAPSAVKAHGMLHVEGGKKVEYETPKEATVEEIKAVVADFATCAKRCVEDCGFDGVELHAANGYLIQQFCAKKTNQRTDEYGGDIAGRCRFLLEVVDATVAAVGASKVSIKMTPGVTFSDLVEPEEDVLEFLRYIGPELSKRNLAYVCLANFNGEPYYKYAGLSAPNVSIDLFKFFRPLYTGHLMINGGLTLNKAREYIADGTADSVAFAGLFLSNANLPEFAAAGLCVEKLNLGGFNMATWYGHEPSKDAEGYTDWPLVHPHPVA